MTSLFLLIFLFCDISRAEWEPFQRDKTTADLRRRHKDWENFGKDMYNIGQETLEFMRGVFIRAKGLYEGLNKGYYRNDDLEKTTGENECLGDSSY